MTGKIDFSYRPETYFSESPNREQLLSKIKGKVRREEARARLETFGFSALNDFIARESLDEEERKAWGEFVLPCLGFCFLDFEVGQWHDGI